MQNLIPLQPHLRARRFWTPSMVVFVAIAVAIALLPFLAAGQVPGAIDPDNLGAIAVFVLDAVRGGDWQLGVLAGAVLLVTLVRKLGSRIPALASFLASDPGGVLVAIGTVLPVGLLTAHLAHQPISWRLAWATIAGAVGGFAILRKLVRPLVGYVPKVGPFLQAAIDLVTGAPKPAVATAAP